MFLTTGVTITRVHLVLEAVPGHVSLALTIRGQQWTCPATSLSPSVHLSAEPSSFEYKICHMDGFIQHVLSMHVFGVVSDIK